MNQEELYKHIQENQFLKELVEAMGRKMDIWKRMYEKAKEQ